MLMIVVLPVPFLARMPNEFPRVTLNEARSRMTLRLFPVQKLLLTFSNSIMPYLVPRTPGPNVTRSRYDPPVHDMT